MTPEKHRIAIARACGWKWIWNCTHTNVIAWPPGAFVGSIDEVTDQDPDTLVENIPDYLNSVDAMLTAVEKLDARQREVFAYLMTGEGIEGECEVPGDQDYIGWIEMPPRDSFTYLTRPASKWAKCFLRAVGKWEGE